jgi:transcription antitermination factor NusG
MSSPLQTSWYVLYTLPQFEKKIRHDMFALKYECYLPIRSLFKRWSDRIKRIEEPLFRNYIFARSSAQSRFNLLQLNGVLRFVSFDGQPVVLPEQEIEKIKLIESSFDDIDNESYYTVGDNVRVVNGVFMGMEGMLIRKLNGSRLLIKFPLLKQAVSVEMPERNVQKILK